MVVALFPSVMLSTEGECYINITRMRNFSGNVRRVCQRARRRTKFSDAGFEHKNEMIISAIIRGMLL